MRAWLFALLLTLPLAAQPNQFLIGRATQIASEQITVGSGPGVSILLFADQDSKIWRGKTGHSLSVIQPGDTLAISYRRDVSGRLMITDLSANIDHIWGRITKVGSGEFEVDQNYNADPQSSYVRQFRQIAFNQDTEFQGSAAGDLRVGRDVDIIGLVTAGSHVEASRIIVYEGKVPVRMRQDVRVVLPNGQVQSPK